MGDYLNSSCQQRCIPVESRTPLALEISRLQRRLTSMASQMRSLLRCVYSDSDTDGGGDRFLEGMHDLRQKMLATRLHIAELKFRDAARN